MKSLHQPNTTYKLVIFDFDGTIADTSPGIIDAHKYTLQWLGKPIPSDAELRQIIGGNLLQTYVNVFQCAMEDAREAVAVYRKRYSQVGIHMAALYPGFEALLQHLKQ